MRVTQNGGLWVTYVYWVAALRRLFSRSVLFPLVLALATDTTAPEPTAAQIPAAPSCNDEDDGSEDDDDDNGGGSLFQVEYSCSDACDTNPQVTGVIKTPSLDGLEVELKTKSKVKVKFDLEDGKVKIQAPDPGALLAQLQDFDGAGGHQRL